MTECLRRQLAERAEKYNDPVYFSEDPIVFPKEFLHRGADIRDIEIAAVFSSHFAWGRRAMIVRDCERLFEQMEWRPYDYVKSGCYRDDNTSIHRTVKWSEVADICRRLNDWYSHNDSLESLAPEMMRVCIFGQKADKRAPNKKINMMRRWLVRNDGKVDLGIWKNISTRNLLIPLDVHVYEQARTLSLTCRKQKDMTTAAEITDAFREIFPEDPAKGDFALFGYGIENA